MSPPGLAGGSMTESPKLHTSGRYGLRCYKAAERLAASKAVVKPVRHGRFKKQHSLWNARMFCKTKAHKVDAKLGVP